MFKNRDWKAWGVAALQRAVRTFFQVIVSMLPASAMINEVDWVVVLGTAALAFVASLCTSLAGLPELVDEGEFTPLEDKENENN
jgi:peptidoglycan/LPS O-acetylase OafA/YrhL